MNIVNNTIVESFNSSSYKELNCSSFERNIHHSIVGHPTAHILLASLLVSITVFAIAANAIVLYALVRWRCLHRSRRTAGIRISPQGESSTSVMLIAAMAFADLSLGSMTLPLALIEFLQNFRWPSSWAVFKVRSCLNIFWCTVTMYNMTSLAIDRYVAVCWPFLYRYLPARSKYVIFGAFISAPLIMSVFSSVTGFRLLSLDWAALCGTAPPPLQVSPLFIINLSVTLYIPMLAMLVLYFKVFRRLSKMNKISPNGGRSTTSVKEMTMNTVEGFQTSSLKTLKYNVYDLITNSRPSIPETGLILDPISCCTSSDVIKTNKQTTCNASNVSNYHELSRMPKDDYSDMATDVKPSQTLKTEDRKQVSARLNAERTLAFAVTCFIFCWLPLSIATTFSYVAVKPLPTWIILVVTWVCYGNAALNPILFCLHRVVRLAVKSFLHIS